MVNFLREVLSNIRSNKGGCFITIGTITVCMTILGGFFLIFVNLKNLAKGLGDNISLIVYLEDNISKDTRHKIETHLKKRVEIKTAQYISKEDALNNFRKELGADEIILDGLDANPLPASYKVRIKTTYSDVEHVDAIAEILKTVKGVESLEYGKEWLEKFNAIVMFARVAIICIGFLLYLGLMFIISNTIKLSLYSNIKEIKIMKLVGARDWYIKFPFIAEGIIQGFLGSSLSLLFLILLYRLFLLKIDGLPLNSIIVSSLTFIPAAAAAGIIALGMTIGCLGSLISLQKFLNET